MELIFAVDVGQEKESYGVECLPVADTINHSSGEYSNRSEEAGGEEGISDYYHRRRSLSLASSTLSRVSLSQDNTQPCCSGDTHTPESPSSKPLRPQ